MEALNSGVILLADDRVDQANLFVEVLRRAGIENEVVIVGDGQEALDWLFGTGNFAGRDTSVMPRLVLLDVHMPRMGGFEALRRIRAHERTRRLPVVIVSATRFPGDVAQAYDLGANGYIDKMSDALPFTELVLLIARYWLGANEPPPG